MHFLLRQRCGAVTSDDRSEEDRKERSGMRAERTASCVK